MNENKTNFLKRLFEALARDLDIENKEISGILIEDEKDGHTNDNK